MNRNCERSASRGQTPHSHHTPPFNHLQQTHNDDEAPPPRRRWGLVLLRIVGSVGPGEAVQQSVRVSGRVLVDDGDEGDLGDSVSEVSVHGETGKTRPNALVGHRVLVGVIPSVGDFQRFDGTDTAVVTGPVKVPGLATVGRGADMMFRALDILRAIGYVDVRPVALLGREIVFGLDRVALDVEIIEHSDGEVECGISVASVDPGKAEEIGGVLEENGINVV